MKVRESGMPGEEFWESLFDIPGILAGLEIGADFQEVIELGCGYGTFTVPVAQKISGTLHAYDIDRTMAVRTKTRIAAAGLHNVKVNVRDVLDEGFDLPPGSADAVILFNILHTEKPVDLLRLSSRTLRPTRDANTAATLRNCWRRSSSADASGDYTTSF